jgi:hypothetical protein
MTVLAKASNNLPETETHLLLAGFLFRALLTADYLLISAWLTLRP